MTNVIHVRKKYDFLLQFLHNHVIAVNNINTGLLHNDMTFIIGNTGCVSIFYRQTLSLKLALDARW